MIKSLLRISACAAMLVGAANVFALTERENYSELFENISDASAPDFAPSYWLHYVDRGSSAVDWYVAESEGGHDNGAYIHITSDCNPYYMTYDCLVTPPVKGAVSFWVKGKRVELYNMTFDGSSVKKGSSISLPSGFSISQTEWQKIELNLEDYTRLGIMFRTGEGGLDDLSAEFADMDDITFLSLSGIKYENQVTADTDGHALVPVSFTLSNKGTSSIDLANVSFDGGLTNYMGETLTQVLYQGEPLSGSLEPGEGVDVEFNIPLTLASPAKSESFTLAIRNNFNNGVSKLGAVSVTSIAGVFSLRTPGTSGSALQAGGAYECDLQNPGYVCGLLASNTGKSPITITDVFFDGSLEDALSPMTLPYVLQPGADRQEMPLTFGDLTGGMSGTVTLVYSDGITDDNEFEFTLSAGIVEEDAWREDFQSVSTPNLPQGWLVEGEGSFRTATYQSYDPRVRANSDQYKESSLITPLMHLEKGGTLTLMGGRQTVSDSHDQVLSVWISPDRQNWTEVGGIVAVAPAGRLPFNTFVAPASANEMKWYNFSLSKIDSGDYYVKFVAKPFSLDNIFGCTPVVPEHDLLLSSLSVPASGEVNSPLKATVTVTNMNSISDSEYVVTLFEGETPVAEMAGVEIAPYGDTTLELSYMPHVAGEVYLSASLNMADGFRTLTSAVVTADIAEEECAGKIVTATTDEFSSSGLIAAKFNKVEFYIPAEAVAETEGTEINEIEFSVYNSSTYSDVVLPYTLWVEEVEEANAFTNDDKVDFDLPETESSAEGSFTLAAAAGSKDAPASFIIPLDQTLALSGKALKITLEMNLTSASYNFYVACHKYTDNYKRSFGKNTETGTYPGATLSTSVPVVTLRYALEPAQVRGVIMNGGKALENAVVTLSETQASRRAAPASNAASVVYSSTTDADGAFSIPVIKSDRSFTLTATHENGLEYVHPTVIAPAGQDTDLASIETGTPTGIDTISKDSSDFRISVSPNAISVVGAEAEVFSVSGVKIAHLYEGEKAALPSGVYIVNIGKLVRKVVIR